MRGNVLSSSTRVLGRRYLDSCHGNAHERQNREEFSLIVELCIFGIKSHEVCEEFAFRSNSINILNVTYSRFILIMIKPYSFYS